MDRGLARAALTICFYKDLQTGLDIFQRLHRFERVPKSWIFALREACKKTNKKNQTCNTAHKRQLPTIFLNPPLSSYITMPLTLSDMSSHSFGVKNHHGAAGDALVTVHCHSWIHIAETLLQSILRRCCLLLFQVLFAFLGGETFYSAGVMLLCVWGM